jgi:hypothetical protein
MTTSKINCLTERPLDGTRKATIRGFVCQERHYITGAVKEGSPAVKMRIRLRDSPVKKTLLCGRCGGFITSMKPVPNNRVTAEKSASLLRASMKLEVKSEVND